jgi:O-antigen biosynthesis protein
VEAERFDASRRRYQDNVCALRLTGLRTDYAPHCRGEACKDFAPAALLTVHRALQSAEGLASPSALSPLVSCIMPTGGRVPFVLQSIRYFQRQDYPNRELIILDDGGADLAPLLPADGRIRYERLPAGLSIGAKRNRACALARGGIVAQWDDDDWCAPDRLSVQVAPILNGSADVTGFSGTVFFDLPNWKFWRCTPDLHARLFVADVAGGTLVFARRIWDQLAQYPDVSLAEDAYFLQQAIAGGARLVRLPAGRHYIYLRHGHNTWNFACGTYLDARGWQSLAAGEADFPAVDRAFYRACAAARPGGGSIEATPRPLVHRDKDKPLVTCIMPTANRRRFVEKAIRYFDRQTYGNRELIIIDDGDNPVEDLARGNEQIRYVHLDRPATVGAKRNLACEQARGEIIAHWDDDDWYAPNRLDYQVAAIARSSGAICGVNDLIYYDLRQRRAFRYIYPRDQRPWLAGNALCYGVKAWARSRFNDIDVGEDALFVWSATAQDVIALPDSRFIVAMIHSGNVSPKATESAHWRPHPVNDVERRLGADWANYVDLAGSPFRAEPP